MSAPRGGGVPGLSPGGVGGLPPAGVGTGEADPRPDAAAWDAFVEATERGSYLQLAGWALVKVPNRWTALGSGGAVAAGAGAPAAGWDEP